MSCPFNRRDCRKLPLINGKQWCDAYRCRLNAGYQRYGPSRKEKIIALIVVFTVCAIIGYAVVAKGETVYPPWFDIHNSGLCVNPCWSI